MPPTDPQNNNNAPPSQIKRYRSVLAEVMSSIDPGSVYPSNYDFGPLELQNLKPHHIRKWMCLKVYGKPHVDLDREIPTLGRSASLEYYKKAVSYFMPLKHENWDELTERGNPTKSMAVLEVVKAVKDYEKRNRRALAAAAVAAPTVKKARPGSSGGKQPMLAALLAEVQGMRQDATRVVERLTRMEEILAENLEH